ncbi:MAG: hypothetical protein LBV49_10185 [Azonexus sp.]|jgi:hypothetical protein|nr:hypothetical protein [Azonexus sp.]
MKKKWLSALICGLLCSGAQALNSVLDFDYGFYKGADFELKPGDCDACIDEAARFYFKGEKIAVPKNKNGLSFFWNNPTLVAAGYLTDDGRKFREDSGEVFDFAVLDKIPDNLSYYNQKSSEYFSGRKLIVKGEVKDGKLIAESIWPENHQFASNLEVKAVAGKSIYDLVRDKNISDSELTAQALWSRDGKPVSLNRRNTLAFILNGAQGDDDEAHGGHFAIATGKTDGLGQWNNLLVNNFYGLDAYSEKGIIASRVPLDLYQAELNSGQSWYRPSYVLMVILKDESIAQAYQDNINRKFDHFYRHHFEYNHALANCAGINLETLRELGWNIRKEGVESYLKGIAVIPYLTLTDSFDSAKKAANYMMTEKTNLYPFVAFNAIGEDLLSRIVNKKDLTTEFEKQLADDIEAIVYIKIPQFPSSRAEGAPPIASFDEYMSRVPANRADWKIVPNPPRPFPPELREPALEQDAVQPYVYAIAANALVLAGLILGIGMLIRKFSRARKRGAAAPSSRPSPP